MGAVAALTEGVAVADGDGVKGMDVSEGDGDGESGREEVEGGGEGGDDGRKKT